MTAQEDRLLENTDLIPEGSVRLIFSGIMMVPEISEETQKEIDTINFEWDEEQKFFRCFECGYKCNTDDAAKRRHVIQFHGYNLDGKVVEFEDEEQRPETD